MAFGIIRVAKMKSTADISGCEEHNARLYEDNGKKKPKNIRDFDTYGKTEHIAEGPLIEMVNQKIKNAKVKPRKDSVLALEYMVTVSPKCQDAYKEGRIEADEMLNHLVKFVQDKHGRENVVSVSKHYDESNPHAHVVVVPLVKKKKKWKNRHNEGEKEVMALASRDFIGGRESLRELQTDFFEHVKPYGEVIGQEFERGTDAREQTKVYTDKTIVEFSDLKEEKAQNERRNLEIEEELKRAEEEQRRKEESKKNFDRQTPKHYADLPVEKNSTKPVAKKPKSKKRDLLDEIGIKPKGSLLDEVLKKDEPKKDNGHNLTI